MGMDGIFKVYHQNKETHKYEELAFFDKDGNKLCDIFASRDHMLNQLLLGVNRGGYDFDSIGARRGVPEWYVEMLKEEHPDWFDGSDYWTYNADEGTYYDYLELRGWANNSNLEYVNWLAIEDEDMPAEEYPRRNPLTEFMNQVQVYLNAYGIYYPKPGEVIIVGELSY